MEAIRIGNEITEAHLVSYATDCALIVGEVAALTVDAEGRCTGGTAIADTVAELPAGHRYAIATLTAAGFQFDTVNV